MENGMNLGQFTKMARANRTSFMEFYYPEEEIKREYFTTKYYD
jgi:hypothetical protein